MKAAAESGFRFPGFMVDHMDIGRKVIGKALGQAAPA